MTKNILIVDDDFNVVQLFALNAENRDVDIHIRSAASGEEAIASIEAAKPDVLVLDIKMPKGDGFSVLEHLQKKQHDVPVVILTNYRNDEYLKKSKSFGSVKDYLVKTETRMEHVIDKVRTYID